MLSKPLYTPVRKDITSSRMNLFLQKIKQNYDTSIETYQQLHQWSVDHSVLFWQEIALFFALDMTGSFEMDQSVVQKFCTTGSDAESLYPWFPEVKCNFAQNILRHKSEAKRGINFVHESGFSVQLNTIDIYQQTHGLIQLIKDDFKKSDVFAAYMPNIPQTVIAMCAATSLGGTFTSTSSDFGTSGVLDRFLQSKPKVLITTIGHEYNGKYFNQLDKITTIANQLPSLEKIILVDFLNKGYDLNTFSQSVEQTVVDYNEVFDHLTGEISFTPMRFDDPVYIMYSSGTTGKPKCIVHSIGGTLLQHVKELGLHTNIDATSNIFYFTTCGWMMWNWLVSALCLGAEVTLYDGSPAFPSMEKFFNMIDREQITVFGTSPKFLKSLENEMEGEFKSNFPSLKVILSTGAPLLPEQFDFVYKKIKKNVQLSSICGGTDILGCFMLGNPLLPVVVGEIQSLGLGMDVAVYDQNGSAVKDVMGELVCRRPFPSMPLYFLDDGDRTRINQAYFNQYAGTWYHGDYIKINSDGSVVVYGRSDATLNPGGVRIGTSEIYRQTEKLDFIEDAICVGQQINGEVEVILFVKLAAADKITDENVRLIKGCIKKGTTPRHVPRFVYTVSDIPYTRSGKKMELVVANILNGLDLNNIEAVANPECLQQYKVFAQKALE